MHRLVKAKHHKKHKVLKPPVRGLNTLSLYICFPKGLHRLKDDVTTPEKLLRSEEVYREQSLLFSLSLSLSAQKH